MDIGKELKQLRNRNKFSTYEISQLTGIPQSTISKLENNKRKPDIDMLKLIVPIYGLTVDEFLKEDPLTVNETKENYEVKKNAFVFPSEFVNADEARKYISMHQIFASEGFNLNKMSDEDVLSFANEMLKQMELISYKYKK